MTKPVAVNSHIMKTMERLVHLRPLVQRGLHPLQFAYHANIGVEDIIIDLLHRAHSHLDKLDITVRIMFLDYTSVSKTIQPVLLGDHLDY